MSHAYLGDQAFQLHVVGLQCPICKVHLWDQAFTSASHSAHRTLHSPKKARKCFKTKFLHVSDMQCFWGLAVDVQKSDRRTTVLLLVKWKGFRKSMKYAQAIPADLNCDSTHIRGLYSLLAYGSSSAAQFVTKICKSNLVTAFNDGQT